MIKIARRTLLVSLAALPVMGVSAIGKASAAEPPQGVVRAYYEVLLGVMKEAGKLGFAGRYERLKPAVEKVFNLPLMTRLAVGPGWESLTPAQQQQMVAFFADLTVATYANRFDGYDGETFEVVPDTVSSPSGTMVQSRLIKKQGDPIVLNYLMRDSGGSWQAIDVFLGGTVSELATRRSEFTSVLRRDGAEGLLSLLRQRIQDMKKAA